VVLLLSNSENRANTALKLSEEQFRRAIEEAPIPTIMQTEDDQVILLSRSWTELTGYKLSDMPTFDNWVTNAVYDGAENVRNHMHELFKGNKKTINIEFTVRTHSKGMYDWSFSASSPGTLLDGRRFIIGMAVDITEHKKAEKALRESEEKYRLIVDTAEEGIWVAMPDGKTTYVNQKMADMLGYRREDILGKVGLQFLEKPQQAEVDRNRRILQGKGNVQTECKFIRKDGSTLWTIANTAAVFDNQGNHVANIAMHTNITKRKKAEETLKETQGQLKLITENSRDGINLLNLKTGKYEYVNPAQVALTGFTAEEIGSISAQEAYERTYPDDRHITIEQQKKIATGEDMPQPIEYRWKVKTGEYRWFSDSRKLVRNEKGQPIALVGVTRDITERKNNEEQLSKIKSDLNRAQTVGKIGSWRLDTQHNILLWSDENHRIFGVPKGIPMTYEAFLDIVHPDDRGYVDMKWKAGLRGEFYDIEHRIVVEDKVKWVRERAEIEFDKNGTLLGGFGTTQDITDIIELRSKIEYYAKHLEDMVNEKTTQLKDSERLAAIGATAGMVGHDIRNPLQAITGELYLINSSLSELPDSNQKTEIKESMESITDNVSYINKIVADLQDYARTLKPEYSMIELPKLIDDTLKAVVLPDNIKLSVNTEPLSAVRSDQTYLRRCITNLVNNGIQAMPNGGTLTLQCHKKANMVYVSISDTGVGIPEHVKERLFTPMMTTKAKGQGLGLAVVKRLIEALNGSITFESQERKGTKFTIELPISTSA
jgi:PAS domain S-box-containing protein